MSSFHFICRVAFPDLQGNIPMPADTADLIRRMLDKDPNTRITVKEILEHPCVTPLLAQAPKTPKQDTQTSDMSANKSPKPLGLLASALHKVFIRQTIEIKLFDKKKLGRDAEG